MNTLLVQGQEEHIILAQENCDLRMQAIYPTHCITVSYGEVT